MMKGSFNEALILARENGESGGEAGMTDRWAGKGKTKETQKASGNCARLDLSLLRNLIRVAAA